MELWRRFKKELVGPFNVAEVPFEYVVEVLVSPPFVFLLIVKALLHSDFAVTAKNCWVRKGGAFTEENKGGALQHPKEISVDILVNLGIPWVILGHSERRLLLNEDKEVQLHIYIVIFIN